MRDVVPPVAQYLRFAYRNLQSTNWSPEYELGVRFMPSHWLIGGKGLRFMLSH
jgi:hypothetical protein